MARTAAGRGVIASAAKLQIDELEYVIAHLIATRNLDISSIRQRSERMQAEMVARQEERQTTMSRIVAALRLLPGYVFRQLVLCILQNNPLNQQLLVENWEQQFNDLDTEFEGDPVLVDALALFAYMNAKSSLTLRLIISFMAGNDSTLRGYLKRTLLITKEDGSLEIRTFDPFERAPSPVVELAPRIPRMFLQEPSEHPVMVDNEQSMRDTSSDWEIEEKVFVRDASDDSYASDTPSFREEALPEFAEVFDLGDEASLRDTSNDGNVEETVSVRETSVSEDSCVSDTTHLQEEETSDFVEDASELSDGSSLGSTPLREPYEVTDISGWTDGQEARFRAN
ncbi:uncharacterized protein EAF01_005643 [Botrytis porri]|uniref:Uncharacterized protein n=1 Tax=Botrytis porri TaxID=87229 RepID=A0A4Z1L543_9HELO|nr:uncharacterized protein EAF01_005643 [Botrytis porri]KAF7905122.1 hypothetical protein EAF01_005643 [Botrytis porri]TGO91899.1 hypothetical protein BPOR_0015g00090 [Botrytis porri]